MERPPGYAPTVGSEWTLETLQEKPEGGGLEEGEQGWREEGKRPQVGAPGRPRGGIWQE